MGVIGTNLVGKESQALSTDQPIVVLENDAHAIFDPFTTSLPVGVGDFGKEAHRSWFRFINRKV
jgi:hypothetical protein